MKIPTQIRRAFIKSVFRPAALSLKFVTVQGVMATRSVNKVILIGHLGKDAETKFTTGGAAKTTFAIATNRRWKDKETGEWKEEIV
ncbi:MAG TPA: single-stranded DNA-binding protein, partial [Bryobacteraceae bacterium]